MCTIIIPPFFGLKKKTSGPIYGYMYGHAEKNI